MLSDSDTFLNKRLLSLKHRCHRDQFKCLQELSHLLHSWYRCSILKAKDKTFDDKLQATNIYRSWEHEPRAYYKSDYDTNKKVCADTGTRQYHYLNAMNWFISGYFMIYAMNKDFSGMHLKYNWMGIVNLTYCLNVQLKLLWHHVCQKFFCDLLICLITSMAMAMNGLNEND